MRKLLTSKKFWVSLAGSVAVALHETMGIDENSTLAMAGIVIAYVLGQGIADNGKGK